MTFIKKIESKRKVYIEYPLFEKENDEDVKLANLFSERIKTLVLKASDADPESKYRMLCQIENNENEIEAIYSLSVKQKGKIIKKSSIKVTYKDGYIISLKNF